MGGLFQITGAGSSFTSRRPIVPPLLGTTHLRTRRGDVFLTKTPKDPFLFVSNQSGRSAIAGLPDFS